MRVIKIISWIFILYIIQTAFGRVIKIYDTVPNLIAAFSVIFAFCSESDTEASYIMLVCGILSGSCAGRIFPVDVLVIGCASLASRGVSRYLRFIPRFIRVQAVSMVCAAFLAAAEYMIINKAIDFGAAERNILPYMIYTLVCSCIIYPVVIKTLFRKPERKLLVV